MEAKSANVRVGLVRILNAWLVLARSRRALFGISIIVFYAFIALAAPLLTPYDPSFDNSLAFDHAVPEWYRTLGIQRGLSGNLVVAAPNIAGFTTPGSFTGWNYSTSRQDLVSFQYSPDEGRKAPGSLLVNVQSRPAGVSYGTLNFTVQRSFRYPYEGSPGKFIGSISFRLHISGDETVLLGDVPAAASPLADDPRLKYFDSNNNNAFDPGETLVVDANNNSVFDSAEVVLSGQKPTVNASLKDDSRVKFVDTVSSGKWAPGEAITYDRNDNGVFDQPAPLVIPTIFVDQDYNRIRFVDSNNSNAWDTGEAVVYDADGTGQFAADYSVISGEAPASGTPLKDDPKLRYVDVNNNNVRDGNETVVYDANSNGRFDASEPVVMGTPPLEGTALQAATRSFKIWDNHNLPREGVYPQSWIDADPPIDSRSAPYKKGFFRDDPTVLPEVIVFSQPVTYNLRFSVRVIDRDPTVPLNMSFDIDDLSLTLLGTSWGLFGTDQQGRDLLSQLVYGARVSLVVGLVAAALGVVIGLFVGLLAGFKAGVVDEGLMRFTDMLLVLPGLPLLIVLVAVLSPGIWTIIGVLGFLGWMGFARVIRSSVVSLKERPFVEASRAVGGGTSHIITRHILPNVMGLTYVTLATSVPGAITAEAALSFLGLFDPFLISWGRMLFNADQFQGFFLPWWILPPGLSIALLSLSFILIGYALDDILNPRLRQRR